MKEKKELVVKSNDLVEASYRLSLTEMKMMGMIISQVERSDLDFKDYELKIKDFMDRLELKGQSSYSELKKIIRVLRSRTFTIKHNDGELITGWISSADYRQNEGVIKFNLDPKLKPYILGLKSGFTPYLLNNVLKLNSFYSGRIYELLKQYQKIGERTFYIDELKNILGIEKNQYRLYGHLKTRVILPTQRELNEKTDITFDFVELTEKRKVVKIKFYIRASGTNEPVTDPISNTQQVQGQISIDISNIIEQFRKLTEVELHPERVQYLIVSKGITKVQKYIDNFDKFDIQGIQDIAGFFFAAVRDEYTIPNPNKRKKIDNTGNFEQREYDDSFYNNFYKNK